jgi:O-antigen/teichoic acid export membrane protein
MSLKFFHIVFISVSTLMCLVVGLWAFDAYRTDGSATWVVLAACAFVGGACLVVYGTRFLQKFRKLGLSGLLALGALGAPSDALACAVCLGNSQSSLRDGMNAGILALLGFVLFMIVSFAVFFIYLWRKARSVETSHEGDPAHA